MGKNMLQKVEYFGLVLFLFILAIAGYRNQIISFGIPLIVVTYFLCKDLTEIRKFTILIPLALLLVLGTRIGTGYGIIHILRDYAYFSFPIAAFMMGYFIYRYIPMEKLILIVVLFGTLYSFVYLFELTFHFDTLFVGDTERTRYGVGTGMPLPVLATIFILFGQRYLKEFKIGTLYWLAFLIINLLVIYYFASRVYYLTLLLYLIPLLYYSSTSKYKKIGNVIFIFVIAGIIGVIAIALSGDNFLAEKLKNSITEMFMQSFEDYESVVHNWRAYELYEAVNTFLNGGSFQKLFGFGFGKTVILEYELIMPFLSLYEIPIFHNGFAYLLVKTGLVGIVLELLFSFLLLYKGFKLSKQGDNDSKFFFSLLLATVLSFNFSLLVVNGFFSGESCYLIILAGYSYAQLQRRANQTVDEKI